MRRLVTWIICSFVILSAFLMFMSDTYSESLPLKDNVTEKQAWKLRAGEKDAANMKIRRDKFLKADKQLIKQMLSKDFYRLKNSSLRKILSSLNLEELEELKEYFWTQKLTELEGPDDPILIGNNTLNILKLKLLREVSNKTYEKILESTLQGKPIIERPLPQSMQIIIATTYRSGSTFLEELLVAHPGVYNHYEPLLMYELQRFYKGDPSSDEALQIILDLLNCRYRNENYLEALIEYPDLIQRNTRLFDVCKQDKKSIIAKLLMRNEKLCLRKDFLEQACALYPWSVMKLVRAGVELLEPVFEEPSLNPQLIFLVRDPRAVINSRLSTVKWCKTRECSDPAIICKQMSMDLSATLKLSKKYPGKVHILRYEDLALSPTRVTQQLVNDLGLDFDPQMGAFIEDHTTKDYNKPWSTTRESSSRVTYWTTKIEKNILANVQFACKEIMAKFGYLLVKSNKNLSINDILLPLNLTSIAL